jgi:carboxymethylenebutenolidase
VTSTTSTNIVSHTLTIQASDGSGTFSAYLAMPQSGHGPGLVVAQEIFGVNKNMRQIADYYAEEGYVALVPDLFWRQQAGVELGYTPEDWQKAFGFFQGFNADKGVDDIQATIAALRAHPACSGEVGVVGYCLGGKLAYLAACRTDADVAIGYYGVGIEELLEEADAIECRLVLHIAQLDKYCNEDAQEKIRQHLG